MRHAWPTGGGRPAENGQYRGHSRIVGISRPPRVARAPLDHGVGAATSDFVSAAMLVKGVNRVRLTIEDARGLVHRTMQSVGYDGAEARAIADHLIDCELRGVSYGGLARAVSIAERTLRTGVSQAPIRVVKETPVSASIDGLVPG